MLVISLSGHRVGGWLAGGQSRAPGVARSASSAITRDSTRSLRWPDADGCDGTGRTAGPSESLGRGVARPLTIPPFITKALGALAGSANILSILPSLVAGDPSWVSAA